jgi:hypothetical protein
MESSSIPLADYFWIAGIESIAYDDVQPPSAPVESTIAEDGEPEEDVSSPQPKTKFRHSRQSSANRLPRVSVDGRSSISTLEELDGNTRSNRSSATIRPINAPTPGASLGEGPFIMGDVDFDKALIKFAAERENFLEDLSFSAGAKVQARAPMINPRAERIRAEESEPSGRGSPLMRSIKGSIRRKMSFRDMNSTRKQPASVRVVGQARPGTSPYACPLLPFTYFANPRAQRLSGRRSG